tara:strand:- start:19372 stop:19710 length:339 start_codon:yes stop_codon:yes gene_type:complete
MTSQVIKNKRKGFAYEAELVNRAKEFGLESKRAWGSNGESIGCDASVDLLIGNMRIQAKRCNKIVEKYRMNIHQDAVVFREDGSPSKSQIMIRYDDFLELMNGTSEFVVNTD